MTTNNKGEILHEKVVEEGLYSDFKRKLNAHYSVQKDKKRKSESGPVSFDLLAESQRIENLLAVFKEVNQFKDVRRRKINYFLFRICLLYTL